jgi:transposase-like protein
MSQRYSRELRFQAAKMITEQGEPVEPACREFDVARSAAALDARARG